MIWLPWRRRAPALSRAEFDAAVDGVVLAEGLSTDLRERLFVTCEQFLRGKRITGAAGFEPSPLLAHRITVLACLPLLAVGIGALPTFHQLILYPGAFRVRREEQDEESMLVTEFDDELAGESWSHGPIVLSAADIEDDLAHPHDGLNVVIHEVAHKLDMASGEVDGVPPMPDLDRRRRFRATLQSSYAEFCRRVDAGEESAIDPYAGESIDEFFAVLSEVLFSAPEILRDELPEAYAALSDYYRWPTRILQGSPSRGT
jgi:hypothetical protein